MINLEQARFNMVEQQIRPWDVLDQGILDLLFEVHREEYVPATARPLAFIDMEIPLGHGEVMLQPKFEARMLQELGVKQSDKVLEIGTGSGYLTALLARQAAHVYSVDIMPEFSNEAARKLRAHDINNVTLDVGDASRGWEGHAPYDVIVLTGSTPVLPESFQNSLIPGGRLFAVVGDAPAMHATLVTCVARGTCHVSQLFETCIPPLRNALQPKRFVF